MSAFEAAVFAWNIILVVAVFAPRLRKLFAVRELGEFKKINLVDAPEKLRVRSVDTPRVYKMNYETLRNEIINDPLGYGYAELGQDYPAIANLLNAIPMIPNPEPQGTVYKRWQMQDFFDAIQPQETFQILQLPALVPYIESAIAKNDRPGMARLFGLITPILSAQSVTNITTMLNTTEPDPYYAETIPGESRAAQLGLTFVQNTDVQLVV